MMPTIETNTRKIVARLEREGVEGGKHDRFVKKDHPGIMITVPRHEELTPARRDRSLEPPQWI